MRNKAHTTTLVCVRNSPYLSMISMQGPHTVALRASTDDIPVCEHFDACKSNFFIIGPELRRFEDNV